MTNINNIVLNTLAMTFVATLFLFAFTWIIFDFQGSAISLKDTWTIVASLLSALTTLMASYIAYLIYSQWRLQAEYGSKIQDLKEVVNNLYEIKNEILNLRSQRVVLDLLLLIRNIEHDEYENREDEIKNLTSSLRALEKLFNTKLILEKLNANILILYSKDEGYEGFNKNLKELLGIVNSFLVDYSNLTNNIFHKNLIKDDLQAWYDYSIKVSNLLFQARKLLSDTKIIINDADPMILFDNFVIALLADVQVMTQNQIEYRPD